MGLYSIIQLLSTLLLVILVISSKDLSPKTILAQDFPQKETSQFVTQIAQKVTVRIVSKYLSGSGVIVSHQNQKYRVLTCAHVLGNQNINEFSLLTPDSQFYQIDRNTITKFKDLDLALVSFQSKQRYSVIKFARPQTVTVGSTALVSGFPNYQYGNSGWWNTSNSGIQAFSLTSGQIMYLLSKTMLEGYRIGLSNDIEIGMSGGPVLNTQGELIAIAGRTKYAPAGIDAYQFSDGTLPSEDLLEGMEVASWAIQVPQSLSIFSK
jgi:serine protease Do